MSINIISSGKFRARVMVKGKCYSKCFERKEDAIAWERYMKKHKKEMTAIDAVSNNTPNKYYDKFFTNTGRVRNKKVLDELIDVDSMSGVEFEEYCVCLLDLSGFFNYATYSRTKTSGDYGADIIITTAYGLKVSVQCKRFKDTPVRIKAVQEVVASKSYYNTDECLIITNNKLTPNAIELAELNDVLVIDRNKLIKLIEKKNENMRPIIEKTQWKDFVKYMD